MAGLELGFTIDDEHVLRLVERAPLAVAKELRELIEDAAIHVQGEMRSQANKGVTANLKQSIRYKFNPTALRAEVGPNVPYAEAVEHGSRPHWVSVREGTPLRKWAKMKGLNPYAVQKSIARKGTKPHPYALPTYNKMKPIIQRDIAEGVSQLVAKLEAGDV